jgi:hypothetical protein
MKNFSAYASSQFLYPLLPHNGLVGNSVAALRQVDELVDDVVLSLMFAANLNASRLKLSTPNRYKNPLLQ